MFKGVLFTLLIAISTCFIALTHLFAQEKESERVIISEKLGDVIDLEERNKYKLFMATKNFKSAILLKLNDENYAFKIIYLDDVTGEENIKWIPRTESEIKSIRILIDKIDEGSTK